MMINVLKNLKKYIQLTPKEIIVELDKKITEETKKEKDGGFIDMTKDKKYYKGIL
jgi:hypothetical protein